MRRKRLRSKRNHIADLSMTPLIDVALTLVIMFMVATPLLQNAIKVTLPQGNAQESAKNESEEIVVYIDKDYMIYLNTQKTDKSILITELKKIIGDNKDKTVYIKADTSISYGMVIELVDDIKFVGGIHYVALATQQHSQKTSSVA